jgi:hypothetical protein
MDSSQLTNRKIGVDDFQKSGQFYNTRIPYQPPVPTEITQYMFRTKNGHVFEKSFELNLLQHIHELKGTRTEMCSCGEHLVNCGRYIDLAAKNQSNKNGNEDCGCDCDVQ